MEESKEKVQEIECVIEFREHFKCIIKVGQNDSVVSYYYCVAFESLI